MGMVYGHSQEVMEWVWDQIPEVAHVPPALFSAIGVERDGQLIGGVVYTGWLQMPGGGNIEMTCAGHGPWLTRHSLRHFFGYPFNQLGCNRITSIAYRKNHKSRDLAKRLGFTQEGKAREAFGPGRDGILFSLLVGECRWHG